MKIFLAVICLGALLCAFRVTRMAGMLTLGSSYLVGPVLVYSYSFREIAISWIGVALVTFALTELLSAMDRSSMILRTPNGKRPLKLRFLILAGTTVLWPLLLPGRIEDVVDPPESTEPVAQRTIDPERLPMQIERTISFTHHIASDEGEDMIWLEEYGQQAFYMTSDAFDEAELGEEATITATVVPESGERVGSKDTILWLKSVKRTDLA